MHVGYFIRWSSSCSVMRLLRRRALPLLAIAALMAVGGNATVALADPPTGTGSLRLAWDKCFGDAGGDLKIFACNTNSGVERLVLSATSSVALPQFNGVSADFFVQGFDPTVPSWWQLPECRVQLAINALFIPPAGNLACRDVFQGGAAGGLSYDTVFLGEPDRSWIRTVAAIAGSTPVAAGEEIHLMTIQINHSRTVGTGSCSGCSSPMGIGVCSALLTQPAGVGDQNIHYPIDGTDSDFVSWQVPLGVSRSWDFSFQYNHWFKDFQISLPTDSKRTTWGGIKSLYR